MLFGLMACQTFWVFKYQIQFPNTNNPIWYQSLVFTHFKWFQVLQLTLSHRFVALLR